MNVGLGNNSYDTRRDLSNTFVTAFAENDARMFAVSGAAGLDIHTGRTDIDVSLGGMWSRSDIDELTEEGVGPFLLLGTRKVEVPVHVSLPLWFDLRTEVFEHAVRGAQLPIEVQQLPAGVAQEQPPRDAVVHAEQVEEEDQRDATDDPAVATK